MTRIILAALTAAALVGPAFADERHPPGPAHHPIAHHPIVRLVPHHPAAHCTIRHHHRVCTR